LAHSGDTDYRIGFGFASGRKHRPYGNVVGGSLVSFDYLLRIVCGNAQPAASSNDLSGTFGRDIVLANMHSIELSCDTKIRAVIHDEREPALGGHARLSAPRTQLACLRKSGLGATGLVAVLKKLDPTRNQFLRRLKQRWRAGKARCIKDCV
jgi:hypothetical protein